MPNWHMGDEDALPPDTRGEPQPAAPCEPNVPDHVVDRAVAVALGFAPSDVSPESKYDGELEGVLQRAWDWAQGTAATRLGWDKLTEDDRMAIWRFAAKLGSPTCHVEQGDIDFALDTAMSNGYLEMLDWTPQQIAADLAMYNSLYEDMLPQLLAPFVADWLKRKRP